MNIVWKSLKMFLWMTLLTGVLYPLLITLIAQFTFPEQSQGQFLTRENKIVGSKLIAQKFENPKYFWPRPSAIDYQPLPSGGSNLGPTSATLKQLVEKRSAHLMQTHSIHDSDRIPSELVYASGSGLDPHLTPAAAQFQIDRILKARNLDPSKGREKLLKLIEQLTEERRFGFLGEPVVNILQLNLALDEIQKEPLK
jgi:K+-transporting ATPase ATPase C chain